MASVQGFLRRLRVPGKAARPLGRRVLFRFPLTFALAAGAVLMREGVATTASSARGSKAPLSAIVLSDRGSGQDESGAAGPRNASGSAPADGTSTVPYHVAFAPDASIPSGVNGSNSGRTGSKSPNPAR